MLYNIYDPQVYESMRHLSIAIRSFVITKKLRLDRLARTLDARVADKTLLQNAYYYALKSYNRRNK